MTAIGPDAGASPFRLPALDGCRALAAIAVVVFHTTGRVGRTIDPRASMLDLDAWVRPLGNYGVCVFFLLSGFLLYRPFVVAHLDGAAGPGLRSYFRRRFLRIYPAYWAALGGVVFLATVETRRPEGLGEYLRHLTLVQAFTTKGLFDGVSVAWTLCIEITFYVSLPFLAWLIVRIPIGRQGRRGRLRAQTIGVAVVFLAAWAYRFTPDLYAVSSAPRHLWLPNYLDWFALGMGLAVAHSWRATGGRLPSTVRVVADRPWLSWLLAAQVYWVGVQANIPVSFLEPPTMEQRLIRFAVNGIAAGLFLLPIVLGERRTRSITALGGPVLVGLGTISYGIYLWHTLVLSELLARGTTNAFFPLFTATMAVTLLVSAMSYFLLERPAMSWRGRRRPPTPAPQPATV